MPGSAYDRALDEIGAAIVDGRLEPGATTTVDALVGTTRASRTIVREATRVLVATGMVVASPRVGLTVQPRERWDVLDANVIRWRLESRERAAQLAELREVRLAIEPEAAALAAVRRSAAQAGAIVAAAHDLPAAADDAEFLAADERLHGAVLEASGNVMLVRLRTVVDAVLSARALRERAGLRADPDEVGLHLAVAAAVADRDPASARAAMRGIVERAV